MSRGSSYHRVGPRPTKLQRDAARSVGPLAFIYVRAQLTNVCRIPRQTARVRARAVEKFYSSDATLTVDGDRLVLRVGTESRVLDRDKAAELHERLGEALACTHEFLHTTGQHRDDGSYVVARRRADSAGHRKVFSSFDALEQLYEQLPSKFGAADVERSGLTGGRRHMVVRHFAEHFAFDCELASRQPLVARKGTE